MDVARGGGKAGMAGGVVVGLGLRVQASVSSSQVSALGRGSAVHDRHGGFRGPSFFVSSSGRPAGREREGISSQSTPGIPGRDPWILAKSRPRDLFVDDSARFVDKSWSPAPAALANTTRGGCCPSGVRANLFPMPFPTMRLALNSHPSDPRAGVAGHPLKPVSSSLPTRRRVNAA